MRIQEVRATIQVIVNEALNLHTMSGILSKSYIIHFSVHEVHGGPGRII